MRMNALETSLRVLSPEGAVVPLDPVVPAAGVGDLSGRHIAFLSNTKPNIDLLLQVYAELLHDRYQTTSTQQRKLNAAVGAGALIKELVGFSDAVVTGVADCGACSAQTARDAVGLEAHGVPTVLVTTEAFEPLVVHQATYLGARRIRMIVLPHPFDTLTGEQVRQRAEDTIDEIVALLCDGGGRDVD